MCTHTHTAGQLVETISPNNQEAGEPERIHTRRGRRRFQIPAPTIADLTDNAAELRSQSTRHIRK